jgi:hypothetical protein
MRFTLSKTNGNGMVNNITVPKDNLPLLIAHIKCMVFEARPFGFIVTFLLAESYYILKYLN